MHPLLQFPFDAAKIMAKKKRIRRELLAQDVPRTSCRIAILGGSTTATVKDALELFLLDKGIQPSFYESEYNKWYEDIMFDNPELDKFQPQIVYIHTSFVNICDDLPASGMQPQDVKDVINTIYQRYKSCWEKIQQKYHATIIQNNFELPSERLYGNLDAWQSNGYVRFVHLLNQLFADATAFMPQLYLQDIQYISAKFGLTRWFDHDFYALYKVAMASEAIPYLADNLAAMIGSILGKSRKCLVLDLDNTLWGGVVSEDEVSGLEIGHETALGESFLAWQKYLLRLRARGIILAVCSKNDMDIAKSGFTHPDCVLKVDDFISFQANWEPKDINIQRIAQDINIGLDSLVFIDDNPAERALVREQLPMVAVPEVDGGAPFTYIDAIEQGKYFETVAISKDDLKRNETYQQNKQRKALESNSGSYEDFLRSLEMRAEIAPFKDIYLARIAQLTNKSNQFNLTTKRYTEDEIRQMAEKPNYLTLYGRLMDRFGDNGLVSVVIGEIHGRSLHICLWLMSCRVLKRDMEYAMLDALVESALSAGVKELVGYYYPTKKNHMVADLYEKFGFTKLSEDDEGNTIWQLALTGYSKRNHFIERG